MRKKEIGFTLVEVLTTIVVLAVLAGLAMPSYFRAMEQGRSNEALTNLNIVHMGEKLFFLNNGTYWGPGATTVAAANGAGALNTDMSATFFTTVAITGAAGNYTARFTRNAVGGGDGVSWFQYVYNTGDAAPTLTRG